MTPVKTIQKYLQKLGLEPETTATYVELVKLGPASALQITRATHFSRTQVYRHLENLQNSALVSTEKLSYGTLYRALPLENIEGMLANREAENAALRRNLGAMSDALLHIAGAAGPTATIRHYYGLAGLKQVNWNLTKAEKEFRVFEAAHLSQHLDKAFARRCREQYIERGLKTYDLTNATQIKVTELEPFNPSNAEVRHIEPSILNINFEMYVYNDVVTLLDYSDAVQMGIEIHHPALNTMMKQLFDAMWVQAIPLKPV